MEGEENNKPNQPTNQTEKAHTYQKNKQTNKQKKTKQKQTQTLKKFNKQQSASLKTKKHGQEHGNIKAKEKYLSLMMEIPPIV